MVGPVSLISDPDKTTRVYGGNRVLLKLIQQAYYGIRSVGAQSLRARETEWHNVPFSAIATAGAALFFALKEYEDGFKRQPVEIQGPSRLPDDKFGKMYTTTYNKIIHRLVHLQESKVAAYRLMMTQLNNCCREYARLAIKGLEPNTEERPCTDSEVSQSEDDVEDF